jgi:type II secretory pathway pseudopilin PulG
MEATTIVLILVAVVIISIVIIVLSQVRERARIERARKITGLGDTYNRANRLLSEIPGQYLTTDLKLILLKRMEDACKELAGLKSSLPIENWQEANQQLKNNILKNRDTRPPLKIDSPEKSTYVKELLENLFKMIEAMHKAGRLDTNTARKNLKYVLFLVHKTHADLHVFLARDFVKQNEIRKAIHAYHMASTEMGKSRDNPLAMKAVKSFRTRIKELETLGTDGKDLPNVDSGSKLDREWDGFLQDDEWKKKADYDDN